MTHKIFGYLSNDDSLTPLAMQAVAPELALGTADWSGVGIGWIQQDRALERKNPQVTGGVFDLLAMIGDVPSRTIAACAIEEITSASANMSPHRFQRWLYAESLEPALPPELTQELLDALPDFLRRSTSESAPASVRQMHHLHALFASDLYHSAVARREDTALAIARSLLDIEARHSAPLPHYQGLLMTERLMIAVTRGAPLYVRLMEGLEAPAPEPLFTGQRTRSTPHPHFRAVLVASADEARAPWLRIEPGHVVWVEEGWKIRTRALDTL